MTLFPVPDHLDRDWQIRLAAFAALRTITERTGGVVTRAELKAGFHFPGVSKPIPFASRGAGIWRPEVLTKEYGAALSVMTSLEDPYQDRVSDEGWIEYGYQKGPVDNHFNTSLRIVFQLKRPVIYLKALEDGIFQAIQPVFVASDHPELRITKLAVDSSSLGLIDLTHGGSAPAVKHYATATALVRLHQSKFRFAVLAAYQRKCSVCSLGSHDRLLRLLDAAHIIPDRDERGLPEISNGLSLCKIHHSAYDLNILGISPDYKIKIRHDILAEIDGPMLRHGIQGMDGEEIRVPNRLSYRPNKDFLAERFEAFNNAA